MNRETLPVIPPQMLSSWQRIVDLIARLADVPAALIMQTDAPRHWVLVSSRTQDNPYEVGREFVLNEKLYCYRVIEDDSELVVENALRSEEWRDNQDLEHGMLFYVGYPLKWPGGERFGTICVLDRNRNEIALRFRDGLQEFARVIESNLLLLTEALERQRLQSELEETLAQLELRVMNRTRELEEANTALRVLLQNIETSRQEWEGEVRRRVNGLVMPHVGKLRQFLARNPAGLEHLETMAESMKSITSDNSTELATAFQELTPAETEIAQMVMRGRTTKQIAQRLSRATSTVDFHRNNIRRKLGLRKHGKSLRSHLLSIGG